MQGQPYDQRYNPIPNNAPFQNYPSNPAQRIAMSYPPSQPLQNGLHAYNKQAFNSSTEFQQMNAEHQPYQNNQNRHNIPGEMPGSEISDNVGGSYMQVYNYGTAHMVQEERQQENNLQQGHENIEDTQDQEQDPDGYQQQQILLFWQHKFFTIFQRFQIIHEKVQWMRTEFYNLNNQLKAVDSENQWALAKEHHDDYMEQIQEFSQELAGVLNENIALYQQQERENDESGIWRQRYYQLFQSYKNLEMQMTQLREGKQNAQQQKNDDQDVNQVIEAYRELQRQYTTVVNQLTELKQTNNDEELASYRQRLEYTLSQAQKYKEILEKLHEQNQQMNNQILQLKEENDILKSKERSSEYGAKNSRDSNLLMNLQSKEQEIAHLSEQLNQIQMEYQKMMQEKENNEGYLYNQTQLLERQLEKKSREIQGKVREVELKSRELQQKNKQLREGDLLKLNIQELQAKIKSFTSKIDDNQRKIHNLNSQLEDKQDELRDKTNQVRDRINQIQRLKMTISSLENKPKPTSERQLLRKQYEIRLKNVENEYDSKVASLKKVIKQKQQDSEINALTMIKLETMEKKNKTLLKQIEKISVELVDKDKELYQLRRSHYQSDKTKHLQIQNSALIDQKQNLVATLLQKNLQIDNLTNKLAEFQDKIRQVGDRTSKLSSKSLISEIQELNALIHAKEAQIMKLKSALNLKVQFIDEMEQDMNKYKKKMETRELEYEKEKNSLLNKNKDLEKKCQDIEKRLREIEFDYGMQMKKSLQDQIRVLRSQNQAKQQQIIRLQVNQMQLQSKLAHFQRIRGTVNSDIDEMTTRIRQLQNSKIQMIKKVESSYRQVKKKEKQIKEYIQNEKFLKMNIADLQNQKKQTEAMAGEKQKIINDLESQLKTTDTRLAYLTEEHDRLRMRRRDETDILIKESDDLKKRLFESQLNPNRSALEKNDSFSDKVKRLEQQKQFLKSQLAAVLEQIGQVPHFRQRPSSSSRRTKMSKGVEGIDYIQKRLYQFNSKIDGMIKRNRQLGHENSLSESQTKRTLGYFSTQSQQIKLLKDEIQSLRKYCAKLEVEANGETIRPNPKYSMVFVEQEKAMSDRLNFYKKQTQELEQRISKLLQINSSLKQRVNSLIKSQNKSNISSLYEGQISQAETTISNLEKRIQKLSQQNRNLKSNNEESNMRMCREYQDKIFECESKIFDLERKIVTLEIEKSKSESVRLTLARDFSASKATLETLTKKLSKHEKQNTQLSKQVKKLENQTAELHSKLKLSESQNYRICQALQIGFSPRLLSTPNRSPIRS